MNGWISNPHCIFHLIWFVIFFRFQSEEEKLSVLVEREKDEIEMLEMVLSSVEHIETLHENKELDLVRAKEEFTKLKEKYPQEYRYWLKSNLCFVLIYLDR